jgi:hypothetical protein
MLRMNETWAIEVHVVQSIELRQQAGACKSPIITGALKPPVCKASVNDQVG